MGDVAVAIDRVVIGGGMAGRAAARAAAAYGLDRFAGGAAGRATALATNGAVE